MKRYFRFLYTRILYKKWEYHKKKMEEAQKKYMEYGEWYIKMYGNK